MRTALATAVGFTLVAVACGGSSGGTSSSGASGGASTTAGSGASSTGKSAATSGTTSGGTNGGQSTSGGSGSGGLAAGQPCSADSACSSNVCGVAGSGKCCTSACNKVDINCGATACDDTGACVFPTAGTSCGAGGCSGNLLTAEACNGAGDCASVDAGGCLFGLTCDDAGAACITTCTENSDCVGGLKCSEGNCVAPAPTGPCVANSDCVSGICSGIGDGGEDAGPGACCLLPCHSTDPACDATGCDVDTGMCIFSAGVACGQAAACFNAKINASACDAHGACVPSQTACPNELGCNLKHDGCNTSCSQDLDCAPGAWCDTSAGTCAAKVTTGPCTANAACTSGICGIAGSGHCCSVACTNTTAPCGASDCDEKGACSYADGTTLCGSIDASCTGTTYQPASACDGSGDCNQSPLPTDCSPYACGAASCLASCTDNTSCASNDFCDPTNSACCSGLSAGGTIAVDSTKGKDAACCGIGTNAACATIFQAMTLIDAAQATGVTINATVAGAGGNWAPAKEVYPIVLGWGAELSAPGVYFTDANGNAEVIDIAPFSANDTGGGASIVGSAALQVVIGLDNQTPGVQSTDTAALRVESGQTLSIAFALVNGNNSGGTTALSVAAGASLLLGSDQSGTILGSVDIGSPNQTDGWNGIICESDAKASTGCTITDAQLKGAASVVIANQDNQDLLVADFGNVTLTSTPTIGVPPAQAGYLQCGSKSDMTNQLTGAVLLQGSASVTFTGGVVQCIDGMGFELEASKNGLPNLTLTNTVIQNTEMALYASAGSASLSGCTIQFNYEGVEQDTDGTNLATIDLSGGGVGTTTVVCSNSAESVSGAGNGPGIDVLNNNSNTLDAAGVTWDTNNPDLFSCAAGGANCTCLATCTNLAGIDDMNAVETSTGSITTTGGLLSAVNCAPPGVFCDVQTAPCRVWETCCKPNGARKSQCVEGPACN